MKAVTDVDEKKLREAIGALNGLSLLDEKIVVKGKTTEDLMESFVDAIDELEDDQSGTLPENVILMYNELIEDEAGEGEAAAGEEEAGGEEAAAGEEEAAAGEEEATPAPKAKKKVIPAKKKEAPAKKVVKETVEKELSNVDLMKQLIAGKKNKASILKAFTARYAKKGMTDADFIAKRIEIYKKIASEE